MDYSSARNLHWFWYWFFFPELPSFASASTIPILLVWHRGRSSRRAAHAHLFTSLQVPTKVWMRIYSHPFSVLIYIFIIIAMTSSSSASSSYYYKNCWLAGRSILWHCETVFPKSAFNYKDGVGVPDEILLKLLERTSNLILIYPNVNELFNS